MLGLTMALTGLMAGQPTDAGRELAEAERAFAQTVAAKGVRDGFLAHLGEGAILFRPKAVDGPKWLKEQPVRPGLLAWEPAFVDVAASGDLGWTTGPWTFRPKPDAEPTGYGHYVSLWRKDATGTWRVVLDAGITHPKPLEPPGEVKYAPAAPLPAGSRPDVVRAELLEADRKLGREGKPDAVEAAYKEAIAEDVRGYRTDHSPGRGLSSLRLPLGLRSGVPTEAHVAQSADLGYTYGIATAKGSLGTSEAAYLRIWRRSPHGPWRLVLDLESPIPPEAK